VVAKILFITGTDTGVGKTVLTCLLLSHLRQSGCVALAMKPFCSGPRTDAKLLYSLQDDDLTLDEINPFYFPEPVAPLVAARQHRRRISMKHVLKSIQHVRKKLVVQHSPTRPLPSPPFLLIEGAGGLLAPLGEGYTALDLMRKLDCEVIVVASNQLGTINHTLLTVRALCSCDTQRATRRGSPRFPGQHITVVIMDVFRPRHSPPDTLHNARLLTELLAPIPVLRLPYLGPNLVDPQTIAQAASSATKPLARILTSCEPSY
jgi:dethiobiotin synthetase